MAYRTSLLLLVFGLGACASTPTGPYWEDKAWMQRFTEAALTSDEHYLKIPHQILGTYYPMGFDVAYVDGKVTSVKVTRSGDDVATDAFILKELEHADFPDATGPYAGTPHHILLDYVPLVPSREAFGTYILISIDEQIRPGLRQRWPGGNGYVLVEFHYHDGVISGASLPYNDAGEVIGEDTLGTLLKVKAPQAISTVAGQDLDLEIGFCFLTNPAACDEAQTRALETVKKTRYLRAHS